ncbi:ABC transporter permease [Fibrella sp. WM1]|uniref:ABC transporter permease n=1 Tax=Fibrella musci TaxID=3242485 RepID=UPI003521097C
MIRHLFTLIWNKKRSNALLLVELLASFLVLFGVTSLIVYNVNNYREPIGYQYKDRWVVNADWGQTPDSLVTPVWQQLKQRIGAYPEVLAVSSSSGNTPFANSTSNGVSNYNGVSVNTYNFWTDDDFARTMDMPLLEGRWFDGSDKAAVITPVVVTRKFREKVFGDEPAAGKLIVSDDKKDKKRIIGVVDNYKRSGEFEKVEAGMFYRAHPGDWQNALVLHVRPGTDAQFEAKLMKDLGQMAKGWNLELSHMDDQRENQHNLSLVPMIIFLVVSSFLLVNVALGLFGVLNVSITRRRGEIGLRRALGATEGSISRQFVGEMWVLATFALVLGLLLAGQFPLMNVFDLDARVYLMAMLISGVVIYLIVTLCALYPSRQAAMVQPAVALHEE